MGSDTAVAAGTETTPAVPTSELSDKDKEFQTMCDEDCTVCYEKKGEDSGLLACVSSGKVFYPLFECTYNF